MKFLFAIAGFVMGTPIAIAAVFTGPNATTTAPSAAARAEIPADLLPVYMAASLTCPGLPWQVLAAIGWVESRHAHGTADPRTGDVAPPIIGPPLDGRNSTRAIRDVSQPDGWAHALGPMQFLSTTWARWGQLAPDRPPDATPNIQNAWDSIYSAAAYSCAGAASVDDVHAAVLRYNHSEAYVQQVIAKATEYGLGSDESADGATFTGSGDAVVRAAMTQLGVPYQWGGETPGVGFDCSGLVQWSYAQIGVGLPRTTSQQVLVGVAVADAADLRPGDLLFTRSTRNGSVVDFGHVAIYAGGGKEVVAPKTGDVVSLRAVSYSSLQATRRIVN
ncbi:MAG TPA: C40 family peptidase [Acidimicrobiales bacterium]|nr:C40 family peptidase [Acidimicrobiales bacterium]HVV37322.1 C40 family peptidase [Acidimicrobiales bacterium]